MQEKVIKINEKEIKYSEFELNDTKRIKRCPSFENIFDDDDDAFENFIDNASESDYIYDHITETADDMCGSAWCHVSENREYIEEAVANGLVDTSHFDLERCFLAGQYEYYSQALYDNLDELCINYMLRHLNGTTICFVFLEGYTGEDINKIIIDYLDDLFDNFKADNNDRFWDLDEAADKTLDEVFENLQDNYEGLVIAIEDNFEYELQEYIDDNYNEDEE